MGPSSFHTFLVCMFERLLQDLVVECLGTLVTGGFALLSVIKRKEPWGHEMVFWERPTE